MFPFNEMYSALPFMGAVFPVLSAVLLVCILEEYHPVLRHEKPQRDYKCWVWYLIAAASLLLLNKGSILRDLTVKDSGMDFLLGYWNFSILPLPVAFAAIGIWKPLWMRTNGPLLFKCLPLSFILAAVSGLFFTVSSIFSWPIMFILEPAELLMVFAIVQLSVPDRSQN